MVVRSIPALALARSSFRMLLVLSLLVCFTTGCMEEPRPRSYMEFMEDSFAREGTLARCKRDRQATAGDADCINARRAATTLAVRADEALREQREAESEAQRAAASDRAAYAQTALLQAEAAAQAEAEAEYEARWTEQAENSQTTQLAEAIPGVAEAYGSTAGTLGPASSSPGLDVAGPPAPSLDFVALPPSASPVLQYIDLPEGAHRREPEPVPVLEEISIPDSVTYRE